MPRASHLVAAFAVAAIAGVAAPAAAAERLPYENPRAPTKQRVADLLSRMTLEEKVGQMTQTERYQVFDDETPITTYGSRLDPVRRRLDADAERAGGVGRHGRPLPARRARHAPRDPAAVRHRRRARQRQRARRDRLPAQHRPGRDPRSGAGQGDRAHHGDRDARERAAVDVRAVRLRPARRPLGPHLRGLQRGRRPRDQDGDGDRRLPGPPRAARRPRPPARHSQALRGRRRHGVRHRRRRLPDRPGRRDQRAAATSGATRCASTRPQCASTTSAA